MKQTRLRQRPATLRRARSLRRQLTPSEAKLWQRLRDRRADIKFRRQDPIGSYVLDFFCPEAGWRSRSTGINTPGGSRSPAIASGHPGRGFAESRSSGARG